MRKFWIWFGVVSGMFVVSACGTLATPEASTPLPTASDLPADQAALNATLEAHLLEARSPDVPALPFADNPDPNQCGIPQQWGSNNNQAWLTGYYEGELYQETVLLYDSHLRLDISAQAPHGSEVEIVLYQANPVTDYYLVRIVGAEQPSEGWIPAPFLSFEPVAGIEPGP